MIKKGFTSKVVAVSLSAVCALVLAGCSGSNYGYTGGVAATVNGVEIKEDTITKYIQDYRTSSDLTSDDSWGQWLADASTDAETIRQQVIDYYVDQEITKQAAAANGITVDSSQVDEQINTMKSYYSSDSAWQEALKTYGITEDEYREAIEEGLLEQQLEATVITDVATDDADVLSMLNTYSSMFDGAKRSSHILFSSSDQELAQQVLNQINAGTLSFDDAVAQYSTDTASKANNGDVGWDCINSFVTEYTDALDSLQEGQISALVQSDYGYHIIKCTQVFTAPTNSTSLSEWPDEIVSYVRNVVASDNKSTAYDTWIENYKNQQEIVINDMPSKVPYNIDVSKYTASTSSSSSSSSSN